MQQLHAFAHIVFPFEMESRVLSLNLLVEGRKEENKARSSVAAPLPAA